MSHQYPITPDFGSFFVEVGMTATVAMSKGSLANKVKDSLI
jgi:hypothetical protein